MKKKIVIGTLVPLMAVLGLYLGTGAASANSTHPAVQNDVSGTATESEQSGTESEQSGTESEQSGTESEQSGTESEQSETESEGAADAAAQHADCLKVRIDDTVTPNVEYDDQTGACSLDTGTDDGGE